MRKPNVEHTIAREIMYEVPEHEVVLSFNSDTGAEIFTDWWQWIGRAEFEKWAVERAKEYEL